jgi:hypothetical protein
MNQKGGNSVRVRAEKKAAERLEALRDRAIFRDTPEGYTRRPEQNLISGVEEKDFWLDLGAGAGNELVDGTRDPAKFCAAFSSSALAVNAFGPFRHRPQNLDVVGYKGFSEAQFEKPLPTGLRGTDPHLDFYAAGLAQIMCIESKFLEPLWPKTAKFADSYEGAIKSLAEPMWEAVYKELKANPRLFKFLDAAQLVKHYLGMRNTLGNVNAEQALLYVYWEPANAGDIEEFCRHRDEVRRLTEAVSGGQIKFVARSYRQLWDEWRDTSSWTGMAVHLSNLEQRYSFSI